MYKNTSANEEQKNIEGAIGDLVRELEELAPRPDLSEYEAANSNFVLGDKNVISYAFNLNTIHEALLRQYLNDMPKRKGLERRIAVLRRRLYALRKQAPIRAFAMAA